MTKALSPRELLELEEAPPSVSEEEDSIGSYNHVLWKAKDGFFTRGYAGIAHCKQLPPDRKAIRAFREAGWGVRITGSDSLNAIFTPPQAVLLTLKQNSFT